MGKALGESTVHARDAGGLTLPDKVYFRIGEVAALLGVEPHVVRFWQTEFPSVRPERSGAGRFLYPRAAVERLARIRTLLYSQGYTIAGARRVLAGAKGSDEAVAAPAAAAPVAPAADAVPDRRAAELEAELERVRRELRACEAQLTSAKVSEAAQQMRESGIRARQKAEMLAALEEAQALVDTLER